MADYIRGIRTFEGDKLIDYNALANLPTNATAEVDGLMSKEDKAKVDISAGQLIQGTKIQTDATEESVVEAQEGAEIFNDYAPRIYSGTSPIQGNIASGLYSHAEGRITSALGDYSHTEGYTNLATGQYSHVEGSSNISSGSAAHAEGILTSATGEFSHAEGNQTTSSGHSAHAEGSSTSAIGYQSHAEGNSTVAESDYSHAEGLGTIANGANRGIHIQGTYNIDQGAEGNLIHIVGNGSADSIRSNAHTLDKEGNAWFSGDVYIKSTSGTNQDEGSKKLITQDDATACIVRSWTMADINLE